MQSSYIIRSETNNRHSNEDSFQIFSLIPPLTKTAITFLAIADGMGGYAHGEQVSREALKKFSLALFEDLIVELSINKLEILSSIDTHKLSQALMNALEQTNAHVLRMVEVNQWGKAGSTIVIAAILEDKAVIANLGDSPLFHYQIKTGKLTQITVDHTVTGVLLRTEMITPEMARYHEGRNRLEFYLGCPNLPSDAPLYEVDLAEGDLLLLCSDGVSSSLLPEQIAAIIERNISDLCKVGDDLISAGKEAGESDNQTLILWQARQANEKQQLPNTKTVIQSWETTRQMLEEA